MSVDITDIGKYSMSPATMVTNLGYSPNLFNANSTKIKPSNDLDDLPHIETQEISVDIIPFCGDSENFDIGITRQDFRIRAQLISTFTIFGSNFTENENAHWGFKDGGAADDNSLYRMRDDGNFNASIAGKRTPIINEEIFYVKNSVSDDDIANNNYDIQDDVLLLDKTEYVRFVDTGQFAYVVPCNRRKVITNEIGDEVEVSLDNPNGIFSEFVGFALFYHEDETAQINSGGEAGGRPFRANHTILKVPQSANISSESTFSRNEIDSPFKERNDIWRYQNAKFVGGKYYSVAKFHGSHSSPSEGNVLNKINADPFSNPPTLILSAVGNLPANNPDFQFPSNGKADNGVWDVFVAQWLNFCLYLPQFAHLNRSDGQKKINKVLTINDTTSFYIEDNNQLIGDGRRNTRYFLRSDLNKSKFVEVPLEDILSILNYTDSGALRKGFKSNEVPIISNPLQGTYPSVNNPNVDNDNGSVQYFFKGWGEKDCFIYLRNLGLI
ncbi:MAG TPA: hypothetical protein PKC24_00690 [Cyclobacteriaceae bacterium]|nr:hypothetical protein [Cyclobacteriaceae bacterium]